MKFRIVEKWTGVYYPEIKTIFGWKRFKHIPSTEISTMSGTDGVGAFSKEDAKQLLKNWVESKTDVNHSVLTFPEDVKNPLDITE